MNGRMVFEQLNVLDRLAGARETSCGYGGSVNIEDVMNFLVEHAARNLPASALSDILDRPAWSLDEDSIAALEAESKRWLMDGSFRQTEVALTREDAFPAHSRSDLVALMDQATLRHPELQALASITIERWDRQFNRLS